MRFGSWTLVSNQIPNSRSGKTRWLMRCTCGTEVAVLVASLKSGKSRRCHQCAVRTHGMTETVEYRIWIDMRRRCHQPQRPDFKNYGARGIYVCDEWRDSFETFYRDMGPRPSGRVLDRRDNAGPYSPDNCHWVTRKQQERNKRTSRFVTIKGETLTVVEASERFGISAHKLYKIPKI
jgi:hypothetical protein